uniref:HD1-like protein n=1 Tax=Glomus macrocarpum TaxID=144533 RepID=A0A410HFG4_9GLOM|nr:HD1-like protein [Glomus macrocarpum]
MHIMKQNRSNRSNPYTLSTRSFKPVRSPIQKESQFCAPNLELNNKSNTLSTDENIFRNVFPQNYAGNEYLETNGIVNNSFKNAYFNRVDLTGTNLSGLAQNDGYHFKSNNHCNEYSEANTQDLYAKTPNPSNNTIIENINHHHPLYQISFKLINIRDKLHTSSDKNHIMQLVSELIEETNYVNDLTLETQLDLEMKFFITTLARNIANLCNKEVEFVQQLFSAYEEFVEYTSFLFKDFQKSDSKQEKSKRQKTDPMSTLWFIKYLLDNNLQKPDKNQRNLLSLWTNMVLHDVNRWFIRTNNNYVKNNEKETARKKLTERAKITSKQLRNTFKY